MAGSKFGVNNTKAQKQLASCQQAAGGVMAVWAS